MKSNIYKQLREMGASSSEADDLARLAKRVGEVKPRGMSETTKRRMFEELPVTYRPHHPVRWSFAGSFAAVALLVFAAQSALPGSWLYRVKRGSEEVRTIVQPSYTETILEERKAEVEQLEQKATVAPEVIKKAEKRAEDAYRRNEEHRRNSSRNQAEQDSEREEWEKRFEDWRRYRRSRSDSDQPDGVNNSWDQED